MTQIPVLLTSSVIAHDTAVALTDREARTDLALESVAQWLAIDPELEIVLCDGSGFDFSEIVNRRFPAAKIECLYFDNDAAKVRLQGRGFGEGEIVRHAVTHARVIRQRGCFAKCTSKLWVSNFPQLANQWNATLLLKAVFRNPLSLRKAPEWDYIDTRFYISSVDSYLRWFIDAHQSIDVPLGYGLEQCFMAIVQKAEMTHVLFKTPPVIHGTGGGTGIPYRNSLVRIGKEYLRLLRIRRSKRFARYFSL